MHVDICGSTRTPSLSNKRYFLLFVDDYTRMIWIYFLDQKSEEFSFFVDDNQMKTLRTNRGGEFIYKPFMQYCKENGIQRQLIVQRAPQQNGVAE